MDDHTIRQHDNGLPESTPYEAVHLVLGRQMMAAKQRPRLDLGDLILKFAPLGKKGVSTTHTHAIRSFCAEIGLTYDAAMQYRRIAAWYTPARRQAVTDAGVTINYSLIRDIAISKAYRIEEAGADLRWSTLLELTLAAANRPPRERVVTKEDWEKAIGASTAEIAPTSTVSPARIVEQMKRHDVRAAVLAQMREDRALMRELLSGIFLSDPSLVAEAVVSHSGEPQQEIIPTSLGTLEEQRRNIATRKDVIDGALEINAASVRLVQRLHDGLQQGMILPEAMQGLIVRLCAETSNSLGWMATLCAGTSISDESLAQFLSSEGD